MGGGNIKELTALEITTPVNYVDYTYTIASGDNGKLKIDGSKTINSVLHDELGNEVTLNHTSPYLAGNTITAETTIPKTNFENAKFEWVPGIENTNYNLQLQIKDVTMSENRSYYVCFSHDKDEQPNPLEWNNADIWSALINKEDGIILPDHKIIEEKGDIYIWICEVDIADDIYRILINGQKIERKSQLPLSKRLKAYFLNEYTSTFCWETVTQSERKINIKIGLVSDTSILKDIKNGKENALQRLLEYSKSAESFYTVTVPIGESNSILNDLHLITKEYYYVYMELEDENGKYYPVEDIFLYEGFVFETGENYLVDCLDDEYEWNLDEESEPTVEPAPAPNPTPAPEKEKEEEKSEDKTTAPGSLPYTGGTFVIIVSVLAIIALGIYAYRRNNDLKGI